MRGLRSGTTWFVLAVAAMFAVPAGAHAAAWGVNDTTDTPVGQACPGFTNCSLREAVTSTEANPGSDTILVSEGTYPLTNGELTVTQDLSVSRVGAGAVTVSGSDSSRIFDVSGSATDFVVRSMTLTDGNVSGAGPSRGGAIRGGSGTTIGVESSTITSSEVSADTDARGGAIYSEGNVMIGTASGSSTGSSISGNSATATDAASTVQGGGVATGGTATLTVGARSSITGNDIVADDTDSDVSGGGAYAVDGGTFTQSTVSGNDATGGTAVGGGVGADAGIATFIRSTVSGNTVTGTEDGVGGGGGGIGVPGSGSADVDVQFSTIANNTASTTSTSASTEAGGGIGNFRSGGAIDAANSTIAGNGVSAAVGSFARGGGLHSSGGVLTLGATILAENTQDSGTSQCSQGAVLESAGYSVLGDISECSYTPGTGDETGVTDAGLDALGNYSGLTETMMLELGSPALDIIPAVATLCSDSLTDQRGVARPQNVTCDSGSVEARPATLTITPDSRSFTTTVPGAVTTANVAISNAGDLPMSAAPNPSVAAPFDYSSGCTSPVDAESNCIMTLSFAPTAGGAFSETLQVTSGSLSDTSTLNGVGWAPTQSPKIKPPGTPSVGVKLGSFKGRWPATVDSVSHQWVTCDADGTSNCTDVTGATHSTYRPRLADVGRTLRIEIQATTGSVTSDPVLSNPSAAVILEPPVNRAPPQIVTATPEQGELVYSNRRAWTGEPADYTFQWIRCDADGTSNCADITPGPTRGRYRATGADVGHTLRVRVVATNSEGSSAPATSAASAVVSP